MKRRKWAGERVKRRKGETEKGRKITDSPTCPVGPDLSGSFGVPRFPDSPIRFQTGFSLLEVMVAVVILGFGLLAIMHLFPIGLRASRISYNTSQASFYAQKKMEELRNTGWSSIAAETKSGISGTIFSQRVTVNVAVSDLLKEVTVAVFWTDYGAERNVELVTYIVDYKKSN